MKYLVNLLIIACLLAANSLEAKILHKERSLYRNILVEQKRNIRCLRFTKKVIRGNSQSCIDVERPEYLMLGYAKVMMGAVLIKPESKNILIIGLGGGALSMTLSRVLPEATIHSVEIDEAVVGVAKEFFTYRESERVTTSVADGRVFVKRAALKKQKYDLIILDAFTGDYIPEHLMTYEYLQELKSILSPGGLVAANTFSTSALYHHESATYDKAFPFLLNVRSKGTENRIIFASESPLPNQPELSKRADNMMNAMRAYGVDTPTLALYLKANRDWNTEKEILTDQFAPANLLKQ
jgi:spermidine synthase